MRMWLNRNTRNIKFWQFLNVALLTSLLLVLVFTLFAPVDVIKNETWKLTVAGNVHYPGDILSVTSQYEKVKDATGTAKRYIECQNAQKAFIRYPINEAEANRRPTNRSVGTGVLLPVPISIPVPTQCKVSIAIKYEIFKVGNYVLRSHTEANESPLFTLSPRPPGVSSTNNSVSVELDNVPIDTSQPAKLSPPSENNQVSPSDQAASSNRPETQAPEPEPTTTRSCTVDILFIHIICTETE